jgi:putative ABC transport system permease protein
MDGEKMIRNYFIIAIRNISKYKVHSLINIAGLATALSVVIMLFLYVDNEISADKYHQNYRNIYRLQQRDGAGLPAQFADIMRESIPEVEKVTRIRSGIGNIIVKYGEPLYVEKIIFADTSFFEIFTYEPLLGDLKTALSEPASIVLIEQEARRLFGNENPIGKTVTLNAQPSHAEHLMTVTAAIKDIPQNSSLSFSGVIPIGYLRQILGEDWNNLLSQNFEHYFLCNEKADLDDLSAKIKAAFNELFPGWHPDQEYAVMPFSKIYFEQEVRDSWRHGNYTQLLLLSGVGFLILIVAVINFINLSIAKSAKRFTEVGIRKVVGANRTMLIGQFLSEAVMICLVAIALALVLVELFIPEFNQLFNTSISLSMMKWPRLLMLPAAGIILGLLAGIYPSMHASRYNPIDILKGKNLASKTGLFKHGLLVLQFAVSISLIICTVVIGRQRLFMQNRDWGFDEENILYMSFPNEFFPGFKQELLALPSIRALAIADYPPGIGWFNSTGIRWKYKETEKDIYYLHCNVDANFLPLVDIGLKEGRFFSDEADIGRGVCILNETAIREFGIDNPYEAIFARPGERRGNAKTMQVIGVVKDFNQQSLHNKIQPFVFFYAPDLESGVVLLKFKSDNFQVIRQTVGSIETLWKKYYPSTPFIYHFLDDELDRMYQREANFEKIFIAFSILAILIACLGLLGLVSFMSEQRTKEIGIRRVLGASVPRIVTMLNRDFAKSIFWANLFAWPIAYYAMKEWLQNFAYRVRIELWIFALASGLSLIIAILTISYHSFKAATANPTKSLRHE